MSQTIAICICKTVADRDKAVGLLQVQGFSGITAEQAETITYDRGEDFYDPAGPFDGAKGFVVIGRK